LQATLAAVDAQKSDKLTDSAEKLRDIALKGRTAAENLQAKMHAVGDRLNTRVEESGQAAKASRLLIIMALAGISLGGVLGFLVGEDGIAKPIRAIVALLQQLAAGNFDIEIPARTAVTRSAKLRRLPPCSRRTASPRSGWRPSTRRTARGRSAPQRHVAACRQGRACGGRDRRNRVVGFDRAGSFREHPDLDCGALAGIGDHGRRGLRGSLD
jgi:HAMP domain-containing protein